MALDGIGGALTMYEVIRIGGLTQGVRRLADGAEIPINLKNMDYVAFVEWNSRQQVPLDLSDQPAPAPTQAEVRDAQAIAFLKGLPNSGDYNAAQVANAIRALRRLARFIPMNEV
jgi:hypothetical protein